MQRCHPFECLLSGNRLPHQFQPGHSAQEARCGFQESRVVVHQQNPFGFHCPHF